MRFAAIFLFLLSITVLSQVPRFESSIKIKADGSPIELPTGYAAPLLTDWDGDGLNDLILGRFKAGRIIFFKNTGSNEAPVLTEIGFLKAGGIAIKLLGG